jgi:iron complex outermembrane recepter protein
VRRSGGLVPCIALFSVMSANVLAAAEPAVELLKRLSLEELLDVEVRSVSRSDEIASRAPAAIYVITQDEIRRSGARTLPEALRLSPNLQVAQTGARTWAISARGFNASFANKLLVLIDGRSVYSPLFSGVFWDVQDVFLEDVERIEVISGPGATLWGANAVNGIINVVTRSSRETQGLSTFLAAGNEERVHAGVRHGGTLGVDSHYRTYVKYFDRDDSVLLDGADASDSGRMLQAGFRIDRGGEDAGLLTIQGDVYDGTAEQFQAPRLTQSGGNILARWSDQWRDGELQLQGYYDHTHQFAPGDFGDDLDTIDLDAQYARTIGAHQRLMLGLGYRYTRNEIDNLPGGIAFLPPTLERHLFSAFVQEEISLIDDRLKVTLGSKFEHNDYTGWEIQPSVRAGWTENEDFFWGAISRAVRTPSRIDRDLYFPAAPPFIFGGGPEFDSETLIAYEAGWRTRKLDAASFSITAFLHDYDDIRTISLGPPFLIENNAQGEIYGLELESAWEVTSRWRLRAGYTLLQEDIRVKAGRSDLNDGQGELYDPQQQFSVRSSLNISSDLELDVLFRFVDQIANEARGFEVVPDYTSLDIRVGWLATPAIELSVVGQNLLADRHREFGFRQIDRAVYAKLAYRYD